jgi:monoamine oxidase
MCGWIDGAIRSGERAAAEVMTADTAAAAAVI